MDDDTSDGEVKCVERDGIDMCLVPAGEFMMGIKDHYQNGEPVESYGCHEDGPYRSVWVDEFWMDKTEVTVRQYLECVQAGNCGLYDSVMFEDIIKGKHDELEAPEYRKRLECYYMYPGTLKYPMSCINIYQAREYCLWKGKRLPTDAEWEKAARGTKGYIVPWGMSAPSCEDSVLGGVENEGCDYLTAQEVCTHPRDTSPYGICDMLGNVREWTLLHMFREDEYANDGCVEFLGAQSHYFHPFVYLRGGGYKDKWKEFLLSRRRGIDEMPDNFDWSEDLGFRCASDG